MIHWKTYRNLAALCLLAIVIFLSYRQGMIDERKRWQYCGQNVIRLEEEDRK